MNAEEVARFLGCSSKTVRRHLEKGTITASRKASGELKIPEDQVEKLRLVLELEDTSRHVHPRAAIDRHEQADMSRQIETDIERRLASLAQSIANLNAAVDSQTRRIGEVTARVTELEDKVRALESGQAVPTQSQTPPRRLIADREEDTSLPQLRVSTPPAPPADIPQGSLLFSDFAALHKVNRATFWRHCTQGIRGASPVETIEIPKPGGRQGDLERWLSPEQQEAALHFWSRQKVKYYLCANPECACNLL